MWESIVKGFERLLERPVILVLILGTVLFVLGAAGGIKYNNWLPMDEYGRWTVLGIGLLLLLGGAALSIDNENAKIDVAGYKIKITKPKEAQTVGDPEVEGTFEKVPPTGQQLWILRIYSDGKFVPLKKVDLRSGSKTWTAGECILGGKLGEPRTVGAYIVGKSGQALIKYYMEASTHHNVTKKEPSDYLPRIEERTEDMVMCDEISVKKG
jgi:hypothetical protein